jgi:hypothetical protein
MFLLFLYLLLHSLALIVEPTVDRAAFPAGADYWDRVGLFKLKDGTADRLVLLYAQDSDSVCDKMMARQGYGMGMYPNSFGLHAVYQDGAGKWVHKEVVGYARVGFTRVAKATPDRLTLELTPKFRVHVDWGQDASDAIKRVAEINKPFTRSVSFAYGVLTAD